MACTKHAFFHALCTLCKKADSRATTTAGLLRAALRHRYVFLLGSQAVRYRRELKALQAFEIENEVIAADDKWLWVRGTVLTRDRQTAAATLHRVMLKRGRDTVDPKDFFAHAGIRARLPLPNDVPEIAGFLEWDASIKSRESLTTPL